MLLESLKGKLLNRFVCALLYYDARELIGKGIFLGRHTLVSIKVKQNLMVLLQSYCLG